MTLWTRYELNGSIRFGTLEGDTITQHQGDMFAGATLSGETVALAKVKILAPCIPTKMVAMWNNFHALAAKLEVVEPDEPLYLLKGNNSFLGPNETVRRPKSYDGKVGYEGELGIVIGKTSTNVSEADALDHVFGYTCINDVTAMELIFKDKTFPQWARAKSFDTFGVYGPVIATGLDPATLVVKTVLNGDERQNYPISDMIFPVAKLVSMISGDMTLMAGDIIACGTSIGVGSMKEKSNTVDVTIDGIGTLSNVFE
ncbi:MAG: fumarylacetoacetate hydrolase family protein [Alphaproteobacteria bacterium]|jgi:2-keto-4-pentenoate hydratase/2-oxohepta-3-ene-1,7-dioic acid hydratase in catechol pathway|nr:fumarylacetoacetate hydrolase family protein [Alphaproteobacteria bacterium]MBT7942089.1 fumarylacetoacetate hydrolase family protein [Alphaproteobacteria bacterium]